MGKKILSTRLGAILCRIRCEVNHKHAQLAVSEQVERLYFYAIMDHKQSSHCGRLRSVPDKKGYATIIGAARMYFLQILNLIETDSQLRLPSERQNRSKSDS